MENGEQGMRRVRGLGVSLAVLMAVSLAARWALTVYEWTLLGSARPATSLTRMVDGMVLVKLLLYARIGYVLAALLIAVPAVVVASVWMARAHANASRRAPGSQRIPRGWAVAATAFSPLGLVLLPLVHTDLWRAADGPRRAAVWIWLSWATLAASVVVYVADGQLLPVDLHDVAGTFRPLLLTDTLLAVLFTVWLAGYAWSVLGVTARQEAWRRAEAVA